MRRIGGSMKEKYDKYWGSFVVMNKIMFIACVLDPRYKLMWIKVAMQKVNAPFHVVETIESDLKDILMKMYNDYRGAEGYETAAESGVVFNMEEDDDMDDVSKEMSRRMASEQSICSGNEVEQYLTDRYVPIERSNSKSKFDVAYWWKCNGGAYPVLSKLVKDVLAVPCSTVASENAFSLGSRVVDPFRSCLTPRMVEALVCTSDWLRSDQINLNQDPSEDDLEFFLELEDVEKRLLELEQLLGLEELELELEDLEQHHQQQQMQVLRHLPQLVPRSRNQILE